MPKQMTFQECAAEFLDPNCEHCGGSRSVMLDGYEVPCPECVEAYHEIIATERAELIRRGMYQADSDWWPVIPEGTETHEYLLDLFKVAA